MNKHRVAHRVGITQLYWRGVLPGTVYLFFLLLLFVKQPRSLQHTKKYSADLASVESLDVTFNQ